VCGLFAQLFGLGFGSGSLVFGLGLNLGLNLALEGSFWLSGFATGHHHHQSSDGRDSDSTLERISSLASLFNSVQRSTLIEDMKLINFM